MLHGFWGTGITETMPELDQNLSYFANPLLIKEERAPANVRLAGKGGGAAASAHQEEELRL